MKKVKKVGLIIMALTSMITMNACSKINQDTAKEVCDILAEKYGEPFEAVRIGDRLNTGSAKLYIRPENNKEMMFIATIDKNTGDVKDDYVSEKVVYQLKKEIIKNFEQESISVNARCMIINQDSHEIETGEYTPIELINKCGFDHYTVYLVVDNKNISAEKIQETLIRVNKEVEAKILVIGYIFDTANFKSCSEQMDVLLEMSTTMIEKYSPIGSFDMTVDNGSCSLTLDELVEKIGG